MSAEMRQWGIRVRVNPPLPPNSKKPAMDKKEMDPLQDFWSTPIPSQKPGVLCTICQSLFSKSSQWHEKEWYPPFKDRLSSFTKHCSPFRTLGNLRRQADAGCHLCASLRMSLMKRGYEFSTKIKSQYAGRLGGLRVQSTSYNDMEDEVQLLVFCGHSTDTSSMETSFSIVIFAQSEDPGYLYCMVTIKLEESSLHGSSYFASRAKMSPVAPLDWMKAQLRACTEVHNQCGNSIPARRLLGPKKCPKRLLDLSFREMEPVVRLVDSQDLGMQVPYVTVSHKWASDPKGELLLTKDTEARLRKACPLHNLPLLFQDIARLVWKLGLRYLWVDTLCIRQDDGADWSFHAEDMSYIYAFATVSICVGSARHHQHLMPPGRSTLPYEVGFIIPTWRSFPTGSLKIPSHLLLSVLPDDEPLFERGWVFQESMLAPRILHFGKEQVFWRCRESGCAELETFPNSGQGMVNGPQSALASLFSPAVLQPRTLLRWWCATVADYTRTVTTYEFDRLHAIGGIASMMQQQLWSRLVQAQEDTQYVAGMWVFDLRLQLSWYSLNERRPGQINDSAELRLLSGSQIAWGLRPKPREYRAPSWSWASVNVPVAFYLRDQDWLRHEYLIAIPNGGIRVESGGTKFGPSNPGTALRIYCNLCQAFLQLVTIDKWGVSVQFMLVNGGTDTYDEPKRLWTHDSLWNNPIRLSWDDPSYEERWRKQGRVLHYVLPLSMSTEIDKRDKVVSYRRVRVQDPHSLPNTISALLSGGQAQLELYLSNVQFKFREGKKSETFVRLKICALLLEPVPHASGRYRRVGLMTLRTLWEAGRDTSEKSIMNAFRRSSLSVKAGQIIGKPDRWDDSVYEIELL